MLVCPDNTWIFVSGLHQLRSFVGQAQTDTNLDHLWNPIKQRHVGNAALWPQFSLHGLMPKPKFGQSTVNMSTGLTHVDGAGKAHMVDVSDKPATLRTATAQGTVYVGPEVAALIKENSLKKGDVLTVSQLAGVIGAKKTSELIPLCHNINLNNVKITAALIPETHSVQITCKAKCHGKTGVEMEALTGVSVAALTVYDMCKAVTHDMVIKEIKLIEKTGGRRDVYLLDQSED